eukprot:gene12482-16742_t
MKDILYDVPISNHGARVRMIIKAKSLHDRVEIQNPSSIGGSKSPEYLTLNPQGKVPLLIVDADESLASFPIAESDTICRYLLTKYKSTNPTFISENLYQQSLSDLICRIHDIYISPIQGAMYKPKGTMFSTFGTDRITALKELKRQFMIIDDTIQTYQNKPYFYNNNNIIINNNNNNINNNNNNNNNNPIFLCGNDITLADVTLFPTIVFCYFILPQFFNWNNDDILPKNGYLSKWWAYHTSSNGTNNNNNPYYQYFKEIKDEIEQPLNGWKENGRFIPIMEEMKFISS